MIQIIKGKKYDTELAETLGHEWNGLPINDFRYQEEVLYRTKKGQFFIAGEGGAMSQYSRPVGNMTGGGNEIRLLTENEAREWLEKYGSIEEYEKVFTPEEG